MTNRYQFSKQQLTTVEITRQLFVIFHIHLLLSVSPLRVGYYFLFIFCSGGTARLYFALKMEPYHTLDTMETYFTQLVFYVVQRKYQKSPPNEIQHFSDRVVCFVCSIFKSPLLAPSTSSPEVKRCRLEPQSLPTSPCCDSSSLHRSMVLRKVRALDCGSLARSLSGGGGGGSILLIDIRPFLAFNLSHIAGSVNINCQVGITHFYMRELLVRMRVGHAHAQTRPGWKYSPWVTFRPLWL